MGVKETKILGPGDDWFHDLFIDEAKGAIQGSQGGGGGASSWDDLKDKPFYSEMVEGAAEFNGDLTGKEWYDAGDGVFFVKISDNPLTPEEIVNSTVIIMSDNPDVMVELDAQGLSEFTVTEEYINMQPVDDSRYMIMCANELFDSPYIVVVAGDLSDIDATMPSEGTYFVYVNMGEFSLYPHSISCMNGIREVITPIDEKFIPDNIVRDDELPSVIIDVVELPTDNIDKNAIYRLTDKAFVCAKSYITNPDPTIDSDYIVHVVDKLPEVGIAYKGEDGHYNLYYNVKRGTLHRFRYDAWESGNMDIIQDIREIDSTKEYVLIESHLYMYNNGWVPVSSNVTNGTGMRANVFNDFRNIASGDYSHAEGHSTTASGYSSHAEGHSTTASGYSSHAEGHSTTASAYYSHAEGLYSNASASGSHAEGEGAIASGNKSHAEGGYTIASGDHSHAEGLRTIASGDYSHAEGRGHGASLHIKGDANSTVYSVSSGYYDSRYICVGGLLVVDHKLYKITDVDTSARTITLDTTISPDSEFSGYPIFYGLGTSVGNYSHSEGNEVIAAGRSQHAQGEYNIIDPEYDPNDRSKRGKYAHIVGNGDDDNNRSNAHTLDWDGNAWFAGTVEGTALILTSPNGTRYKITVSDDGTISANAV